MLGNQSTRWGTVARAFHGIGLLLILALIIHGWWMTEFPPREQRLFHYSWHASIGYALLFLTALRLVWRWLNVVPDAPAGSTALERTAAHIGHWGLYLLMLAASVSGWGLAGTFRAPLDAKLFGIMPVMAIASNENPATHEQLEVLHIWFSWSLAALVVIHIAAAIYHRVVKRDGVMQSMFGR
jgi:cytochrome b561